MEHNLTLKITEVQLGDRFYVPNFEAPVLAELYKQPFSLVTLTTSKQLQDGQDWYLVSDDKGDQTYLPQSETVTVYVPAVKPPNTL